MAEKLPSNEPHRPPVDDGTGPSLAIPPGYPSLCTAASWAELPGRTVLVASGRDAVRFLNGFTTAAIERLAVGAGCEGFITDARGWVIGLVDLLRTTDGLRIEAGPGLGDRLVAHFERYHIREEFTLDDRSSSQAQLLVAGPRAPEWFARHLAVGPPGGRLDHALADVGGADATAVRVDWYGVPGFRLGLDRDRAPGVAAWLESTGLPRASLEAVDAARIEAGSPEPGDIPEKTLPQELDRDERAISFAKGCYLGQETVARIDALGHVNRRLAAVACRSATIGSAVMLAGSSVGTISSLCHSPRLDCLLGLSLIQIRGLDPGARLEVEGGEARVVPFPALATAANP